MRAMAHPPDPALTRAVGEAIKYLRDAGWETRDIADRFQVASPTVTRWENGNRAPELKQLPILDELCGKPKGYVLRLAGYVDDVDIVGAIEADPALTSFGRNTVSSYYRYVRDEFEDPDT